MQAPPPASTLLQLLATTASEIDGALRAGDFDWKWKPQSKQWSLTEVLCHLRDVEKEVHQHRFRSLIAEENAFLAGVSADEWASARGYYGQDGPEALAKFLAARRETIALLEGLPEESWKRQGRHAFFGPTSMQELAFLVVRHDELHWRQIKELLAQQNVEALGEQHR